MTNTETQEQSAESALRAGRDAIGQHTWSRAIPLLIEADAVGVLGAEDLDALSEAYWWTGQLDESIATRERAYAGHTAANDTDMAAMAALALMFYHHHRLAESIASGWLRRAERLLDGRPESVAHGYLERAHANKALGGNDFETALEHARRESQIGERIGDVDLQAVGLHDQGRILVAAGQVEPGMEMLDEAMAIAIGGQLSPFPTAIIYCNVTIACQDLGDYRRAVQWSDAAKRWCERQAIAGFPGMCRVRRAEVTQMRGHWLEAEAEARLACDELQGFNAEYAAQGLYQIGELRLRMGDMPAARDAFQRAHELGRDPLPGLALLHLAEGRPQAAASGLDRALADPGRPPLVRARLLPAAVETAIALGDTPTALARARELQAMAETFGSEVIRASASAARAAADLAAGEVDAAVIGATQAWRLWHQADAPYEAAQARVLLGRAYLASDDPEQATLELTAAATAFERLGAPSTAAAARALLPAASDPTGNRQLRTFVFTDIVGSTPLIEAIGDEAWENLQSWHDTTLRALFARHHGEEVHHAGDGFFVAFPDPASAIDCSIAIQRALTEHSRNHGFAPRVRIGVHADEAMRRGTRWEGRGVHLAARVAALAGDGEILATAETAEMVGPGVSVSGAREEKLRGMSGTARLVVIDWG
ncbi:MAG: adenylate/guanylate cyclase domain-containing protein [Candidatus Limnocylindria bacterium]